MLCGCASLIGIDDYHAFVCRDLTVIGDTGQIVPIAPMFASDHADYAASVPPAVTSVHVEITCDDPDAVFEANGMALPANATAPLPVGPGQPAVFDIAARAGTAAPAPELDYRVSVGVTP